MAPTPQSQASSTPTDDERFVALAVFTQPHGVSGRIKVKSFTDPLHDFAQHKGLCDAHGTPVKLRITGHIAGGAIVEIEGVTKREQAELLRGKKIGITRSDMPALANPNMYYTDDLIGMQVVDAQGDAFGVVRQVMNYGAGDILEITTLLGTHELYAFNHATFPLVDTATRKITIHPPEILEAKQEP
jgi:16S rRNA processing protein RimM